MSLGKAVLHRLLRLNSVAAMTVIGLVGLGLPAVAQDNPGAVFSLAVTRSSPFDPPTKDVFVADDGPGLDTGCTFNTSSNHPLRIDVMVDQAVGPVDGNGFLVNPSALVAEGVIPATVAVIMPAFDVDINGAPPPENDEVLLNGERLGLLTGDNQIWKLNSFSVPVSKIKFPTPVASGSPSPVANRVQINVDILSRGRWCTAIDWVALVIPIKLKAAFKLEPTIGNDIRVRDYASAATIDTIYEQSFDADCGVTTDVGPYDDYPFSGPATPGSARLHATVKRCPANDHLTPEVKVDWKIGGTSLTGVATWSGNEGDIDLTMPSAVGVQDVKLTFTIDEKKYPAINRKLFVTKATPLAQVNPPRLGWYEKATSWANGQSAEAPILTALLGGEYSFGQANWRYGYNFGSVTKCTWLDLVQDPISCDYADCFIFSDVLENMAATVGVGGLSAIVPLGTRSQGFLTSGAPSLDPAFPGSAKRFGTSTYDRYLFSSHSLRLKSSRYYDATFNGRYSNSTAFITANLNGSVNFDTDGVYYETDEGWKIYDLGGSSYDSWGNYAYKSPTPVAPSAAPVIEGLIGQPASATTDIAFTGNATYNLVDEDVNGLAEALTADVEVRIDTSGQYTILGTLRKAGQLIANRPSWESMLPVRVTLNRNPGTYTVTLQFSGEQIYRSGVDGPYDLVLIGIATSGFTTATLATPAYDNAQFGETPAHFTGVSEAAVDTTGDGKFELIDVTLDLDVRLPGELRVQGALEKGGRTLVDAGTSQDLTPGARQVTLHFDGRNIRRSGLDGPYDGSVNLIDASGHTIDSIRFTTRPYSAGSFSAPIVPQGPFTDQGIDTNGNGLYDLLRISFGAEIEQAGSYRLTGVLRSASSQSALYADSLLTVPAGATTVRLEFSGPVINALRLEGPYTVDLLVRDPATLQELDAVRLPFTTAAYSADEFDPFGASNQPIVLTGNSSDSGVDTNGNGLFDELRVNVEVALARTDFYEWGARLVDRNGTELGFYTRRATLSAGVTNIDFVFDGEVIGENGVDGPYLVKSLLIFGRSGANLVSVDVAETQPYRFTEFEGARDVIPPQITVSTEPTILWPPNHTQESLAVADFVVAASDSQDPNVSVDDVVIIQVTSDEPADALGKGDGSTSDDIVIAQDCRSVQLRSERAGGGNGRVYTIHVAVADASDNVGTTSYIVTVPHDSSGGGAIADGPAYAVGGCTP